MMFTLVWAGAALAALVLFYFVVRDGIDAVRDFFNDNSGPGVQ